MAKEPSTSTCKLVHDGVRWAHSGAIDAHPSSDIFPLRHCPLLPGQGKGAVVYLLTGHFCDGPSSMGQCGIQRGCLQEKPGGATSSDTIWRVVILPEVEAH